MNPSDQDEILIVVDENDEIIDYLPRKQVHEQRLLHRTISISVYNDQNEILLQKRSTKKDNNPSMLANAAGGHVTKDTSYEQTAVAEIEEELGITPDLILIKKMILNDPAHTTMTSLYKASSNGPFNINLEEVDEIKFYSKEKLKTVEDQLSESAKIVLREQNML